MQAASSSARRPDHGPRAILLPSRAAGKAQRWLVRACWQFDVNVYWQLGRSGPGRRDRAGKAHDDAFVVKVFGRFSGGFRRSGTWIVCLSWLSSPSPSSSSRCPRSRNEQTASRRRSPSLSTPFSLPSCPSLAPPFSLRTPAGTWRGGRRRRRKRRKGRRSRWRLGGEALPQDELPQECTGLDAGTVALFSDPHISDEYPTEATD